MTDRKNAEPMVADANAAVLKELPFADRHDYADAERGFIGSLPEATMVRSVPSLWICGRAVWGFGFWGFGVWGVGLKDGLDTADA